ncbi:MAG TPA: AlkA N-terminal domain-containing protein, partial [Thermoanaerobaculia bacterium]|nr:AlkA N-terminal domain-containing protein [Thermoanaerobaculia bacterium]
APRELRRASKERERAPATGMRQKTLNLKLPVRAPFDATSLFSFLEERALPGVEAIRGHTYSRTIESRGRAGVLTVSHENGRDFLQLSLNLSPGPDLLDLVRRAGRIFDVDADPLAIGAVLSRDPLLEPLVAARPGLRVPGAWDPFELAVRAILGQQVSVRGARTLAGRLVAAFGRPLPGERMDGLTHVFPSPAVLAAADLSGIGVSRARAAAIRTLAGAVHAGSLELAAPRGLDEFENRMTALPGVGPWTAHIVALRAFGEPDAFPAGDLGLRRALETAGLPADAAALRARAASWSPFRAYATLHLWNSLAAKAGKKETR